MTLSDQVIFLWACCKSACRREKIYFPYTVEDFADNLTPEDLTAATASMLKTDGEDGDGEKKA